MGKPCYHDPVEPDCAICRLAETHAGARRAWGIEGSPLAHNRPAGKAAPKPPAAPCLGCLGAGPQEFFDDLLPGIADPLPDAELSQIPEDWPHRPAVKAAHAKAFHKLLRAEFAPPPMDDSACVLIIGGGKFARLVETSARQLRLCNSALDVQIWYRGGEEPIDPARLIDLPGITFHDSCAVLPRPRVCRGWEAKLIALTHVGEACTGGTGTPRRHRYVLYLDADAYCVADPAPLLELARQHPAVFWRDLPGQDQNVRWRAFGLAERLRRATPPIQGGQLVIDRAAFWREIVLTHWLCQHSDYTFAAGFGDQDAWRIALAATGGRFKCLGAAPWFAPAFVLCHGGPTPPSPLKLPGKPMIVHRCQGKGEPFDRRGPGEARYLPAEKQAGAFFHCAGPKLRPDTWDETIWRDVAGRNEYGLPDDLAGAKVLDVGAHTGSFAWACLRRGAASVLCVEPEPSNYRLLCENLAGCPYPGRPDALHAALGAAAGLARVSPARPNTGTPRVGTEGENAVPTLPIDELIERAVGDGPLDVFKLDCEGAEVHLLGASRIGQVRRVVGEYHMGECPDVRERLAAFLGTAGFSVEIEPTQCTLGHFKAWRP